MLYSTEQHKYDKRHLIIVFDEIDKMLLSGEFGVLKAHELLKLLDQDILHLQTDDGKHQFTFDASCVSIVLVGAFTELRKQKAQHKPRIGFLSEPKPAPPSSAITMEDLIRAGVSPEICGRIQQIINLNAPSVELYHQIACNQQGIGASENISKEARFLPVSASFAASSCIRTLKLKIEKILHRKTTLILKSG